jgi:hypothetical protein
MVPQELTEEQAAAIRGMNVAITFPVSSTGGDVLAVPLAALTAGPGGEARVEIASGGTTRLVEVTTGLAAGGFVEIVGSSSPISAGDLVVVGQSAATGSGSAAGEDETGTD